MLNKTVLGIISFFLSGYIFAQTQSPIYLSQSIANANAKGFYQYLPADYTSSTKNYPLIIWIHGAGQVGQGTTADLPKVLEWGVPKIISEGGFPSTFSAGDSNYSFIVISPQFIGWPSGNNVAGILTYVMNNYRVNPDRVYLMGISAGGGAAWEFAGSSITNSNKLAAMIPFCGALTASQIQANRIAASNLPVWAFHNTNDGTVPVSYSRNWTSFINTYIPTPNPLALLTEFPVVSNNAVTAHECWSLATLPTYKPNGKNIYEWLLGYKKRLVTVNLIPFASAGQDLGIVLPANAVLDGSASTDADGLITSFKWRKILGPAAYSFSDSTIVSPVVSNLQQGLYQFELTVTDNLGAAGKDTMSVNTYSSLPAGAQQRVLIDVGGLASYGGTITPSPSINGLVWNNMTDARPGIRISNALAINNQLTGISVEVINRVDGTYSTSSLGIGNGNTTGIVGDYPASATTDHALIHKSASNGKWRIKGLQTGKVYVVKFWGTRTNTTAQRSAEIKRSDDNVWKSYNATANSNYNNAAVFNITGKTEMDFDIRTKSGSDFSAINVLDISFGSDTIIVTPPPTINLSPIARAGADFSIQLPVDSAALNGCSSSDPENALLKYKWRKIGGPATYQLTADTVCAAKIKGLITGIYLFELLVTDTAGLTGKDTLAVTVNNFIPTNWPAQVTPLCNKPYTIVVVGSSTAFGTGASPIDSSWVRKFKSYLLVQNQQIQIINIATLGLSSWDVSPTGTVTPFPFTVDTLRNITKALSYLPDAIILNLPSNDVAKGIPTDSIHNNYNRIAAAAAAQQVPLWVTTTQGRDGISPAERQLQINLRDWINATYGNKAVDFWNTVTNADGTINAFYGAGDGVHLNNYGHHVLFTRIIEEKIWDTICIRNNIAPQAKAGNDTTIFAINASLTLNGLSSSDADGSIVGYSWRVTNNGNATISNANTAQPLFSTAASGIYRVELKVTDNIGAIGVDTIVVQIATLNNPPLANAGTDIMLQQITDSIQLNGSLSSDIDGSIIKYKWQKISGPSITIVNDSMSMPWIKNILAGNYSLSLTVTDDSLATATDTVYLFVNASPVAGAGSDQTITLPTQIFLLNGNTSTDPDGTINTYIWRQISAGANSVIANPGAVQTSVTVITEGAYLFELEVTDNSGAKGKDTVSITINPDPNFKPVANAGSDIVITLPINNTSLNATASVDNDGSIVAYQWRKISGPSTVSIADSTAIITAVNFVLQGQYLFELMVTDNLGATGKDSVKVTVNPDPNTAPVSNAGPDKSIQLPANIVLADGRSSYDPEGAPITYNWTLLTGPAGSQLLSPNKDTCSITFINSGIYTFKLTVTDAAGLSSVDNVIINVLPVPDVTKRIKVNINGTANPYNNTQWNSWNMPGNATSAKFLYEDGSLSTVNASITAAGVLADNGANYATAATVCPYQVLRYNSANTSIRTLTFSGLNINKQYGFEFYASRANTGNSTVYLVGSKSDTISTSSNVNDYAKFLNISPDNTGKIIVNLRSLGTWNYIAGFMIVEQEAVYNFARASTSNKEVTEPLPVAAALQEDDISKEDSRTLLVYPNPSNEVINLKIPGEVSGKYSISITDIMGKVVAQKQGRKNKTVFTETIPINHLPKGKYALQLIYQHNKLNRIFIKL